MELIETFSAVFKFLTGILSEFENLTWLVISTKPVTTNHSELLHNLTLGVRVLNNEPDTQSLWT